MDTILPLSIRGTVHRLSNSLFRSPLRRKPSRDLYQGVVAAEILEDRALLSAVAADFALDGEASDVALTSSDIDNPRITVTGSGNDVVETGTDGTMITYGSKLAAVQSVLECATHQFEVVWEAWVTSAPGPFVTVLLQMRSATNHLT